MLIFYMYLHININIHIYTQTLFKYSLVSKNLYILSESNLTMFMKSLKYVKHFLVPEINLILSEKKNLYKIYLLH